MAHTGFYVSAASEQVDYRDLVEETLAGVFLEQGGRLLYVNPMLAEMFGYRPEELVAERTLEELVAVGDRERVRERLRRGAPSGS